MDGTSLPSEQMTKIYFGESVMAMTVQLRESIQWVLQIQMGLPSTLAVTLAKTAQ